MCTPQGYLLVLAENDEGLVELKPLLSHLQGKSLTIAVAHSIDQAITWIDQQPPYLVILAGERESWSAHLVDHCRCFLPDRPITLVALTGYNTPTWISHEANPGFDGFLVEPISPEILLSLVHAAQVRQACAI